jgi:hypothetical protein
VLFRSQGLSREVLNSQRFDRLNHQHFEANLQAARVSAAVAAGKTAYEGPQDCPRSSCRSNRAADSGRGPIRENGLSYET